MVSSLAFTPGIAARGALQTIQRFLDSYGVGLAYRDSDSQQYQPVISVGYPAALMHFLAVEFPRQTPVFEELESNPDQLFCWRDFPGFEDTSCVQKWLKPQGISEGSSMILRSPSGQINGALHVSLRGQSFPDAGVQLLEAMRPELEKTVAEIRSFRCLKLTPREIEVLSHLREGKTNAAIAQQLWLSPSTVRAHVESILRKMSARSRTEAAVKAERWGIGALLSSPAKTRRLIVFPPTTPEHEASMSREKPCQSLHPELENAGRSSAPSSKESALHTGRVVAFRSSAPTPLRPLPHRR